MHCQTCKDQRSDLSLLIWTHPGPVSSWLGASAGLEPNTGKHEIMGAWVELVLAASSPFNVSTETLYFFRRDAENKG